jgi:hypothetical protein
MILVACSRLSLCYDECWTADSDERTGVLLMERLLMCDACFLACLLASWLRAFHKIFVRVKNDNEVQTWHE